MQNIAINENQRLLEQLIEKQYTNVPAGVPEVRDLAKIDAPILSTTTGYYNAVFGASVFQQLNTSSTLFGALPKFQYQRSGYRAQTDRFLNSGAGVGENAAIPDTLKPILAQITVGVKEHAISLEYSERQRLLASTKDDVGFDVASVLERAKESFIYAIDADMNGDVTTVAGNNIESIDRIVSSYAEVTNCGDLHTHDSDIYGLNRDGGATYADAYVNHNSNSARPLTKKILRDLLANTLSNGANPNTQIWYTGMDTYENIMALEETKLRYSTPTDGYKPGTNVNDGKTAGINFGAEPATLYGRPIFVAPTGKVATNGNISNLYLLDVGVDSLYNEPKLGIKVLQAPILAETRLATYPVHQKLGNKHVLYMAAELECKRFNVQGKARDLDVVA